MSYDECAEKFRYLGDHIFLLIFGELGIDGKGQGIPCRLFRMGKVAFFISEVPVTFLQVEGERVIDIGTDPFVREELPKFIPLGDPNHILVVNMSIVVLDIGELYTERLMIWLLEELVIVSGVFPPFVRPFLQIAKFRQEDGGL
jgi:hypothetical protein